jgi:LacI family transcriptional regulator, galactose operon repressor
VFARKICCISPLSAIFYLILWERFQKVLVNLEEIARLSGVSRSTVSRVINNHPKVNSKTRAKVYEIIQRMDYHPSAAARRLAGGRTNILGLVIPMGVPRLFTDPFFPLLIQGVSQACSAHEHSVMLWVAEAEYERRTIRQVLQNKLIDGVIIASAILDDPLLEALIEGSLPFVLVGRHPASPQVNYVDVDNYNSTREIVTYLLRLGHRRIGTISGPQNMIAGLDRLEGYRAALRQWGLPVEPELAIEGDFTEEGGYRAMQRLIPHHPQATFCASDAMAIGALRAVREASLRVPDNMSVASFDDLPFSARSEPPLTTVRQPILRLGTAAVETLMDIIVHPDSLPRNVILPTELIIRASCCPAVPIGKEAMHRTEDNNKLLTPV